MCGIIGMISLRSDGIIYSQAKAVHELMMADSVRGVDGTGLFHLAEKEKNGKKSGVWFLKQPVSGPEFMSRSSMASMIDGSRFVVCHNRAATLGELTEDHTHPFSYDGVTGVHNGTVRSWRRLKPTEATMDSQAIIEALSKADADGPAVGKLLADIEGGAYSLVWYDSRTKSLRFARNNDRPMHMVVTANAIWFASELRMLEWVLERNKISMIKSWATETHKVIDIPTDLSEITVTDYSDDLPSWGCWSHAGYDDAYRYPSGTSMYPTSAGYRTISPDSKNPRAIEILDLARIPKFPFKEEASRKNLIKRAIDMSGIDLSSKDIGNMDISVLMSKHFEKYVPSSHLVEKSKLLRVDYHICDITQTGATYGFVLTEDGLEYASSIVATNSPAVQMARKINDGCRVAVIPDILVLGLKFYHNGFSAYKLGAPYCDPDQLKEGAALGGTLRRYYGWDHPDRLLNRAPAWDVDWDEEWVGNDFGTASADILKEVIL